MIFFNGFLSRRRWMRSRNSELAYYIQRLMSTLEIKIVLHLAHLHLPQPSYV